MKTLAEFLGFEVKTSLTEEEKEHRAIRYAEEFGILDYKVKGNRMIYYANYPAYLNEPRRTYKVTVRLNKMTSEKQLLTKWNPKGNVNMYK